MKHSAKAIWSGTGKEGGGVLSSQSNVLNNVPYTWKDRFDTGTGTNPEELIAAAHAGCFSMKLSFILGNAGFTADEIMTDCSVTIDNGTITKSELMLRAKIPGIDKAKFEECANEAKANCPVSKALNAEITLDATLL
jgi:osmotically inducible protein OsmC